MRPRDRDRGPRGDRRCVATRATSSATASSAPRRTAIKQLHEDPDRLTAPLVAARRRARRGDAGTRRSTRSTAGWRRSSPSTAATRSPSTSATRTRTTSPPCSTGRRALRALGTHNVYSASTVDQMPKQVSAGLMFGTMLSHPGPGRRPHRPPAHAGRQPARVEREPAHGARHARAACVAIRERGGKVVVIDPRRSRTAEEADEHHFIRPGTDALLLAALACTLVERSSTAPGRLAGLCDGLDQRARADARLHARGRGRDLRDRGRRDPAHGSRSWPRADRAAVYARIGTCTQEFGTLASWLVDVLNVLTGNLDREGGAMFTARGRRAARTRPARRAAAAACASGAGASRVRGLPEVYGELPVACLAEEIDTPGDGQVRALITVAGNPLVSTPNCGRLAARARDARLHGRVDIYVNETTRHADVILPGARAAREVALRPRALPARRPQRGQLLAAGAASRRRRAARVGDAAAPGGRSWRARGRTPTSRRSTTWSIADAGAPRGRAARLARRGARSRRAARRARAAPRARAHARLHAAHRPLRRRLRRTTRTASPSSCSSAIRTAWTSARSSRASRRCCARRRAGSSSRPSRSSPTSTACAAALDGGRERRTRAGRAPPAALEQLLDAQPARAREGQGTLHDARPPRATPSGSGWTTARRAPLRSARRRARGAGGGHRRDHARRRSDAPRLGPRRGRRAAARRRRARGREQQRARRRGAWSSRYRATRC